MKIRDIKYNDEEKKLREIIIQSNKNIYETMKQIKNNTDDYKIVYFVRPQKWISRISGRELMIGRYYYFTGVVSCLYGEILSEPEGCIIKGEFRMSKAHRNIFCLILILVWSFLIDMLVESCNYNNIMDFGNNLMKNSLFYIALLLTGAAILWSRIVKSKMLEDEVVEFLKDILS